MTPLEETGTSLLGFGERIVLQTLAGQLQGQIKREGMGWFLYDGDRLDVTKTVKKLIDKGLAHENDGQLVKGKK